MKRMRLFSFCNNWRPLKKYFGTDRSTARAASPFFPVIADSLEKGATELGASTPSSAAKPADDTCKSSQASSLYAQSAASLVPVKPNSKGLLKNVITRHPLDGRQSRLADRLIPLFPPHECYVEIFADGAALYFMRPQAAPVEVLNDINSDLVTLCSGCPVPKLKTWAGLSVPNTTTVLIRFTMNRH